MIVLQDEETIPDGVNNADGSGRSLAMRAKVVSHGEDGVFVRFVFLKSGQQKELKKFLQRMGGQH